ncbi:MAG: MtrAB system histidine kinase MtrB [Arcanobacterium sp.]|nr:MtrAB system histidine kinase MtrB [Arcanobacterium sp.]MDY5589311.1 MtrAB system histidine kinase MtrB [Arcanobacterium sp.]
MNPEARPAVPATSAAAQRLAAGVQQRARGTFFERLWAAITGLQHLWASSLRLRVITIIIAGGTVGAVVIGITITSQERAAVFEQAVQASVEQFAAESATAQENFSAGSVFTTGQNQQVANELVASMYDPARGLMGAVLMRSSGQESTATQIVEPATASAATLRSLVSKELRAEVAHSPNVAWQSVAVPRDPQNPNSTAYPGIVVGTALEIPSSGSYELYAVYSLKNQEALLDSTYRVLSFGIVALILIVTLLIVLVLRLVLRPVQEASEGARQLAEGALDTRMEVEGSDELAQLATSFNQMASSLEDQFARMERMSAVQTAFVSAVSHELRSPVTTIRMAGQLIYDKREELPPALKRSAELQHDQLLNLDTMLSDLLEISRYDAGAMNLAATPANVAEIAKRVIEMAQPLADSNGVAVKFVEKGDPTAEVEPRRIERIIRNLVVNALEHGESRPIRVRVVGSATAVAVEVMDHGIGLSAEQAAHVFDRFWRADTSRVRKTGGTGLGLTIAREDALIHGGILTATGELGVGSTFLLVVPKHPGAPYQSPIKLEKPTLALEQQLADPAAQSAQEPVSELASDGVEPVANDGERVEGNVEPAAGSAEQGASLQVGNAQGSSAQASSSSAADTHGIADSAHSTATDPHRSTRAQKQQQEHQSRISPEDPATAGGAYSGGDE